MSKSYETSKTHFQLLQALFKVKKVPGESTIDFSGRVDHYLSRLKTIVRARYQAKYGEDHTVTTDEVFDLLGSLAILMQLEKDDNLMNFLSRDLDDCFSPRDIAKHADRYLERRQVGDPVLSNPVVNYARNHNYNEFCKMEKRYKQCTREKCRFKHKRPRAPGRSSNRHRGGHGKSDSAKSSPKNDQQNSAQSDEGQRHVMFANQYDDNEPFTVINENDYDPEYPYELEVSQ